MLPARNQASLLIIQGAISSQCQTRFGCSLNTEIEKLIKRGEFSRLIHSHGVHLDERKYLQGSNKDSYSKISAT